MLTADSLSAFANVCSSNGYLKPSKAIQIVEDIELNIALRDRVIMENYIDNELAGDRFSRTDCLCISHWILEQINAETS